MLLDFLFKKKTEKQTVVKNFFWLSFGQIVGRGFKALLVIWAARILGASEYGRFSFALGIVNLIFNFSHLGLNTLTTREVATQKEPKKYISTIFYIRSFLISVAIIIALIAEYFVPSVKVRKIILVLMAMATLETLVSYFYGLARGLEMMEKEAFVYLSEVIATVTIGFVVLFKMPSAFNLAIAYSLGALSALLVGIKLFSPYIKAVLSNFDKNLVKPILRDAWPLALTVLIASILGYTDITMIGWLLKNSKEIGIYSAPLKIVQLLFVPAGLITGSIFPLLSRKTKENKEINVLRKTIAISLTIALPLSLGGIILSKEIVLFLFGKEYIKGGIIFAILILTLLAVYPTTIFGHLLIAKNLQKKAALLSGISTLFNIVLNYILILKLGIVGAALATTFSQFLNFILFLVYTKRLEKAWPISFTQIKKPLTAGIIMSLFLLLPPFKLVPVLIKIGVGGFIYLTLLILLKEQSIAELKALIKER